MKALELPATTARDGFRPEVGDSCRSLAATPRSRRDGRARGLLLLKQTPVDVKHSSTVVTPIVSGMKLSHGMRDIHGLVVIDEIQRRPDLFPVLRVLADRVEAVPLDTLAKPGRLFEENAS